MKRESMVKLQTAPYLNTNPTRLKGQGSRLEFRGHLQRRWMSENEEAARRGMANDGGHENQAAGDLLGGTLVAKSDYSAISSALVADGEVVDIKTLSLDKQRWSALGISGRLKYLKLIKRQLATADFDAWTRGSLLAQGIDIAKPLGRAQAAAEMITTSSIG